VVPIRSLFSYLVSLHSCGRRRAVGLVGVVVCSGLRLVRYFEQLSFAFHFSDCMQPARLHKVIIKGGYLCEVFPDVEVFCESTFGQKCDLRIETPFLTFLGLDVHSGSLFSVWSGAPTLK
jgi:hypothetical protein